MDATNVVTSTDTAGIEYHHQGQPAHLRTITTTGDDHRTPSTPQVDAMTEGAIADPIVRLHQRDRSISCSRYPSTDRHTSRDRNTGQRHTSDCN